MLDGDKKQEKVNGKDRQKGTEGIQEAVSKTDEVEIIKTINQEIKWRIKQKRKVAVAWSSG